MWTELSDITVQAWSCYADGCQKEEMIPRENEKNFTKHYIEHQGIEVPYLIVAFDHLPILFQNALIRGMRWYYK